MSQLRMRSAPPARGLGTVPAGPPSAVARTRPDALLWTLAGFFFFEIGRIQQVFPAIAPLRPALLLSALAFLLFFMRPRRADTTVFSHPVVKCMLLIVVWGVLSIPTAVYRGGSFSFLTGTFVKTVMMSLLVTMSIRSEDDAQFLCFALFASIGLYALVAIQRFQVGSGERLAELYTYDANDIAQVIVTVLPFGPFFLRNRSSLLTRTIVVIAIGLLLGLLVKTGSRGGFVGLCAALGYTMISGRGMSLGRRLTIVGVAATLLVVLGSRSGYWSFINTMTDLDDDYNVTASTGRIAIWKRGFGYMMSNPVTGVGIGGFPSAEGRLSGMPESLGSGVGWKWSTAHNSFVQIGAELGIPGLLAFGALWVGSLRRARRLAGDARLSLRTRQLGLALSTALVAFLTTSMFLSQAYSSMLYILVMIVVALERVQPRLAAQPRRVPVRRGAPLNASVAR